MLKNYFFGLPKVKCLLKVFLHGVFILEQAADKGKQ